MAWWWAFEAGLSGKYTLHWMKMHRNRSKIWKATGGYTKDIYLLKGELGGGRKMYQIHNQIRDGCREFSLSTEMDIEQTIARKSRHSVGDAGLFRLHRQLPGTGFSLAAFSTLFGLFHLSGRVLSWTELNSGEILAIASQFPLVQLRQTWIWIRWPPTCMQQLL